MKSAKMPKEEILLNSLYIAILTIGAFLVSALLYSIVF